MLCYAVLIAAFIELVQAGNGTMQKGTDSSGVQQSKQKQVRSSTRKEKRNLSVVPSHLVRTDISSVKEGTLIFSGMMFCILPEFLINISLSQVFVLYPASYLYIYWSLKWTEYLTALSFWEGKSN